MVRAAKSKVSKRSQKSAGKTAPKSAKSAPSESEAPVAARDTNDRKGPLPNKEVILKAYRDMLLIRRFEEKASQLYGQGAIAGFCHLYIGQEAVVVGMLAHAKPEDTVVTTYRDHGHMLACGMSPKGVMAELTGRQAGYSKGKGGSMHMFSKEKNFYGGHGIVGASVPIGTGLGFLHRYRGSDAVSQTYYGDGAANQGQVHESFNMAALWKLPVLFIVENNQYGMGTSVERASASADFYRRGEPFGIPGRKVDGMDILEVMAAGRDAINHCRAGRGPFILQMETYRYRGHSMSDPARYRTREEVNTVREKRDPIKTLANVLLNDFKISRDAIEKIDDGVKKLIADAADFAMTSPEPDPAELYTGVLVEA
ncbi:MAG: pyruvate dehydrogenase (acetyl-transferring) E1 component subunit alpha [Acidobacteriota bacterium]